jgi:hypothetical protein
MGFLCLLNADVKAKSETQPAEINARGHKSNVAVSPTRLQFSNLYVVVYGCETWSLTLREENIWNEERQIDRRLEKTA